MHPSWKRGEAWGFEREDVGKDERVDSSRLRFDKADDMEDSRAISLFTLASCQNNWKMRRGEERKERAIMCTGGGKEEKSHGHSLQRWYSSWLHVLGYIQLAKAHGAWNETRGTMLLELAKMFAWNVAEGRLKCKQNTVEESKGSGGRRSSRRKQNVIVLSSFVRGWL